MPLVIYCRHIPRSRARAHAAATQDRAEQATAARLLEQRTSKKANTKLHPSCACRNSRPITHLRRTGNKITSRRAYTLKCATALTHMTNRSIITRPTSTSKRRSPPSVNAPAELTLQSIQTLDLFLNRLILKLSYNYKLKLVPESL